MVQTTAIQLYEMMLIRLSKQNVQSLLVDDFVEYVNTAQLEFVNKRIAQTDAFQSIADDLGCYIKPLSYKLTNGTMTASQMSIIDTATFYTAKILELTDIVKTTNSTITSLTNQRDAETDSGEIARLNSLILLEETKLIGQEDDLQNYKDGLAALDQTSDELFRFTQDDDEFSSSITMPENYVHLVSLSIKFGVKKQFKVYRPGDKITKGVTRLKLGTEGCIMDEKYLSPSYERPYYSVGSYPDNSIQKEIKIFHGNLGDILEVSQVTAKYIQNPVGIHLTEEEIDDLEDKSQVLNLPKTVINEIAKIATRLVLENTQSARLQTNAIVSPDFTDAALGQK